MSTKLRLFYPELQKLAHLHKLAQEQETMMVEGRTVGECLQDLVRQVPGSQDLIFNEQGRLLKQVYVYVNAEGLDKADFARKVTPRDELILAVLVTGG
jgi:hypothetical protein